MGSKFARRRAARRAGKAALLERREERRQAQAVAVKRWAEAWIERVREDRAKGRGIDRVPEHLRLEQERQYVVEHYEPPFTPYINPARDKKRGARLRQELR